MDFKTVNIKGKDYVEVNERIKYFRTDKKYDGWSLTSDIVSIEDGVCIMKATITDGEGVIKATGYAYEKEGSTFINKTSYIENAETSAWGRALGNLGIGIDTSIATSEEVQNAINNQKGKSVFTKKQYKELVEAFNQGGRELALQTYTELAQQYDITGIEEKVRKLGEYYKENGHIDTEASNTIWKDVEALEREVKGTG